jgi:hypothetical protein
MPTFSAGNTMASWIDLDPKPGQPGHPPNILQPGIRHREVASRAGSMYGGSQAPSRGSYARGSAASSRLTTPGTPAPPARRGGFNVRYDRRTTTRATGGPPPRRRSSLRSSTASSQLVRDSVAAADERARRPLGAAFSVGCTRGGRGAAVPGAHGLQAAGASAGHPPCISFLSPRWVASQRVFIVRPASAADGCVRCLRCA